MGVGVDYTAFAVIWEGWDPVNRFHHTGWVAIVTKTDRPKFLVAFVCRHVAFLTFI